VLPENTNYGPRSGSSLARSRLLSGAEWGHRAGASSLRAFCDTVCRIFGKCNRSRAGFRVYHTQLEADLALAAATFERFLVPGTFMDNSVLLEPAFALKHYTQQRPRDAAAAHVYALICERLGGTDEAVASLERAAAILEEEFEATYSMALCNLGRVRLATGGYQGSLEAFTNCWELDPPGASLRVQCKLGQGLAYFWLGQVDECFEAFLVSLDEAENSGEAGLKDEVVVLLSRTLWGLGTEDAKETAKTHLLES